MRPPPALTKAEASDTGREPSLDRFRVDVFVASRESGCHDADDSISVQSRAQLQREAQDAHARGYWVEVISLDSGELLAGPFDPDEVLPPILF